MDYHRRGEPYPYLPGAPAGGTGDYQCRGELLGALVVPAAGPPAGGGSRVKDALGVWHDTAQAKVRNDAGVWHPLAGARVTDGAAWTVIP